MLDRWQSERTDFELVHELFDGVTVSPVIQDIRQIRNDGSDARGGERAPQVAVPLARAGETVGDERDCIGGVASRLVNVDLDPVTVELDDFGVRTGTCGFARGGGAREEGDR